MTKTVNLALCPVHPGTKVDTLAHCRDGFDGMYQGASAMLKIDSLQLLPVWLDRQHMVSSARILLAGHKVRAIGVVEGGKLLGVVTPELLAGQPDSMPVGSVMVPPNVIVESETPVRRVAERMYQEGADYAAVVRNDQFVGIVTATMLLRELGRSWDPMTGLSWSDRLREWGIDQLKRGVEITILFVDLDEFGVYNKKFGHIVGDRVLQQVAGMLHECIDSERDILVRYGGDEFAIGTIRPAEDAYELAEKIQKRSNRLAIDEADDPIRFSIGIFGGKRTKERENTHYAATLDNLINAASRDSLAKKAANRSKVGLPTTAVAPTDGASVVRVFSDEHGVISQVILTHKGNVVNGVAARHGRSQMQSVAEATVQALAKLFPDQTFVLGDLTLTEASGEKVAAVSGERNGSAVGSAIPVGEDLFLAVAQATLHAFNSAN